MSDADNKGVPVAEGSELVLDLNGHELVMHEPGTGSQGTETLAFQFLKDSDIIIKNGVIDCHSPLKMGLQNYSNLTLDNVTVNCDPTITYALSNNYGNIVLKNGTTLNPTEGNVAFDLWYGMSQVYDDGINITIADNTVKINGPVEYGKASRASQELFEQRCSLTIPTEMELTFKSSPEGFGWVDNGDGSKTFKKL